MGTGIRLTWECECEGLRIDCMEMEENGNVKNLFPVISTGDATANTRTEDGS